VRAFGPGNVIPDLIAIGGVDPRPAGDLEIRPEWVSEVDVGYAIHGIRAREEARIAEVAWRAARRKRQARHAGSGIRSDVNAVPVVVKGHFIEQGRADGMRGVNNGAVPWIVEGVSNCGQIVAAPLARSVPLGNLLGDEVSEHGEPIGEVLVDADHLLLQICFSVGAAAELALAVGDTGGGWRQKASA